MSEPVDTSVPAKQQTKATAAAGTPPRGEAGPTGLRHYLAVTRGPWYGFLFALPILLAYESLIWAFRSHVVNGADALLSRALAPLFLLFGADSRALMMVVLLVTGGIGCYVAHRRRYQGTDDGRLRRRYFLGMLLESVLYAIVFAPLVNKLLHPGALQLAPHTANPLLSLAMAFGAGVYEELFFRVLLMGGLALLLTRTFRVQAVWAWLLAALASSLVFSAFHYLGSMGDAFSLSSFMFRFGAGVLLAAIYGLRGFGIAVWTHAIFDILVTFFG